jgi:hypothetical protein
MDLWITLYNKLQTTYGEVHVSKLDCVGYIWKCLCWRLHTVTELKENKAGKQEAA